MTDITIYHNPACGTSRTVLGMIRESGVEPTVIEYLKSPLDRESLRVLVSAIGIPVRDLMRSKEAAYVEFALDDPTLTDEQLIDAMLTHPVLMNRPIVITPLGARLCRPSDTVLTLLS